MARELRPSPSNIEAEQAVIGACILTPSIIGHIEEILDPQDLYREAHVSILQACYHLHESCDLVTLADYLTRKGILEKIGGQECLMELATCTNTSAGWRYWVGIIKDCATRRKLMAQCQTTFQACYDLTRELPETLMDHEKAIQGIEQGSGQRMRRGVHISNVYTPERMIEAYSAYIAKLKDNRFLTGIDRIDKIIRGVAGGEILTIIARPGAFKTATLQNMMGRYVKESSMAAVMFEIEMPVSSMTERQMQISSGFRGHEIEAIFSHPDEAELRDRIEREFIEETQRLFVIPTKVGLDDIPRYVNLIEQNFRVKVGLMGVDYVQLMDETGSGAYERITKLATGFKVTAKLLDIPGILLSQTSRKGGDAEMEITLDMGRDSGAIEEAADVLLGLWWNKATDAMEGGELICKILKARKGKRNLSFVLDIDPETLQLKPNCYPWEPPKGNKRVKGLEA